MLINNEHSHMKKIAHIIRNVDGGAPIVVKNIVNNLKPYGYSPIVVFDTSGCSSLRTELEASDIPTIGLHHQSIQPEKFDINFSESLLSDKIEKFLGSKAKNIYMGLKSMIRLFFKQRSRIRTYLKLFRDENIILVHTHNGLASAKPEIIASKIAGIPCILHCHTARYYNWFDLLFSYIVDDFIFISSYVSKTHKNQSRLGFKGHIIHNGVDLELFKPTIETNIKEEFSIPNGHLVVAIIGRLVWWKGHDCFIEALSEVSKHIPVTGLIIGGINNSDLYHLNFNYLDILKRKVKSLSLEDIIIFTGHRTDIPRLLSGIDILVNASSEPEPFGLTIIEGMALGKPVIAAASGGVLDILKNGENGLLFPSKDSKKLASAILDLSSNDNLRTHIIVNAKKTVISFFDVKKQIEKTLLIYDSHINTLPF